MLVLGVGASGVSAQEVDNRRYSPVDQAFEDLDPLMTSLRRVEVGLNLNGEQTSLFRLTDEVDSTGQPVMYRLGPGFRARVNRLDYVVIANPFPVPNVRRSDLAVNVAGQDGLFIEAPTANTVYDLRPIPLQGEGGRLDFSPLIESGEAERVPDPRLNRRLDPRVGSNWPAPMERANAWRDGLPDLKGDPNFRLQQVWPRDVRQGERPRRVRKTEDGEGEGQKTDDKGQIPQEGGQDSEDGGKQSEGEERKAGGDGQ